MENLKVKVSSEAESKEVQELFSEFGLNMNDWSEFALPKYISNFMDGEFSDYSIYDSGINDWKEITIPYLRDLVVLNRNDVGDATHKCETSAQRLGYLASGGIEYIWSYGNSIWFKPKEMNFKSFNIKPIGKKEMKEQKQAEFLVKTDSGYVLQVLDENAGGEDVVRVPDGADIAVKSNRGYIEFRKGKSFYAEEWCEGSWHVNDFPKHEWDIVWKRETLNDQVASAEEYREMISSAAGIGLTSVVTDIAQSCGGGSGNALLQGQSDFPLNNYELNHRVAKAFNAVRETNLNEDDVNYIRELINLTISHYGERK